MRSDTTVGMEAGGGNATRSEGTASASATHYDVREVAAALGVSVQTVYLLCAKKRLRHIRVGVGRGTIRVPADALQEYIDGATVGPSQPTVVTQTKQVKAGHLRLPSGHRPS